MSGLNSQVSVRLSTDRVVIFCSSWRILTIWDLRVPEQIKWRAFSKQRKAKAATLYEMGIAHGHFAAICAAGLKLGAMLS